MPLLHEIPPAVVFKCARRFLQSISYSMSGSRHTCGEAADLRRISLVRRMTELLTRRRTSSKLASFLDCVGSDQ